MATYRKKPVEVEAVQLRADNVDEVLAFAGDKIKPHPMTGVVIETLEGNMLANEGDYIIKGIKGEFYPCKPDIFAETYEEVDGKMSVKNLSFHVIADFRGKLYGYYVAAKDMSEAILKASNCVTKSIEQWAQRNEIALIDTNFTIYSCTHLPEIEIIP